MREFVVTEIRCEKGIKATEICNKVLEKVKYNRLFFELTDLLNEPERLSKKQKERLAELDLEKYAIVRVYEHIKKNPEYYNYDPKEHDRHILSNLNDAWYWYNETENDSLDESKFRDVVAFGDTVGSHVSTVMYGIDEIEWGGKPVSPGTYGYKKAKELYNGGDNYLSNSVIVSKIPYEGKPFKVYVSCEKEYRDLEIVEEMISSLGKKIGEKTYFAPENEEERHEWEETYREAEERFKTVNDVIKNYLNSLPKGFEPKPYTFKSKVQINMRKCITKHLCGNGWEILNKGEIAPGTYVGKRKGDRRIYVNIDSLHRGHYVQSQLKYDSPKYYFCETLPYAFVLESEQDVCEFLKNIRLAMERAYELL